MTSDCARSASTGRRRRCGGRVPVIGVVGPIGAGKTEVARLFSTWAGGTGVVSGDEVGRHVMDTSVTLRRRLTSAFGSDILQGDAIDRACLAARAFVNSETTSTLNRIVHPPLLRELNRRIRRASRHRPVQAVIVDAALLVEWGREAVPWDHLIGVWAPQSVCAGRLMRRGWTRQEMHRRRRAQIAWREKRRLCDCIVNNDSSRRVLYARARLCWQKVVS